MTDPTSQAWRRLGCAVIWRAWLDAKSGNGQSSDARLFLESDGAAWLLGLLELPPALAQAIAGELPPACWVQLAMELDA